MELDRLDTRRILQAAIAVHAAGGPVTFDAVSGRLEENGRRDAGGDRVRGGSGGRRVRNRMGTEVSGAACWRRRRGSVPCN